MAYHLNPYQFAVALLFGVLAAWLYVYTQSLWPSLIGHCLMNLGPTLIVTGVLPWKITGYSMELDQGIGQFQPLWFDALGAVLAALGLLGLWHVLRRRPEPGPQGNA